VWQCVVVCCSVLQCVAVCCSVLQCVTYDILRPCCEHNLRSGLPSMHTCIMKNTTHCNVHCNILQYTAIYCITLRHVVALRELPAFYPAVYIYICIMKKCNTLQHTATHWNTLQNTTTHCDILRPCCKHALRSVLPFMHICIMEKRNTLQHAATCCNTLAHTKTHCGFICNTLQHTATYCNTLAHITTHCGIICNTLQHAATCCNMLQHTTTHCSITWIVSFGHLMRNEGFRV